MVKGNIQWYILSGVFLIVLIGFRIVCGRGGGRRADCCQSLSSAPDSAAAAAAEAEADHRRRIMATAHEVARSAGKEVERDFREKDKEEGVVLGRADGGGSRSRGVAAAFRGGDEEAQRNPIMETAKAVEKARKRTDAISSRVHQGMSEEEMIERTISASMGGWSASAAAAGPAPGGAGAGDDTRSNVICIDDDEKDECIILDD